MTVPRGQARAWRGRDDHGSIWRGSLGGAMSSRTGRSAGTGRSRKRRVLLGLAAAAALVACGTAPAPPPPVPAPTTTPAPDPLADAADGADLTACADGSCEVRVVGALTVPVDPRYGVSEIAVEPGVTGRVTLTATITRAGSVASDCQDENGSCDGSVSLGDDPVTGASTLTVDAVEGYRISLPALVVDPAVITPDGVLLRLSRPAAADGTDIGACADGECSVQVKAPTDIPIDPGLGSTVVRVEAVEADAVTVVLDPPAGTEVTIACGPENSLDLCPSTFDGALRSRLLLGGQIRLPSFQIGVTSIDGTAAVLEFRGNGSN